MVPFALKPARVCPVFKKKERCKAVNYRPIYLISVPCKVLEHIIVSTIMGHGSLGNKIHKMVKITESEDPNEAFKVLRRHAKQKIRRPTTDNEVI